MSDIREVTGVRGARYRLGCELGRGGQGAVFAVEGGRLAVKLVLDRSPRAQERLRDQLAMVGRLPLDDLDVARPLEQLRPPHVGYVMDLFTGMVPLRSLGRPPKGVESVKVWYAETGGLRRRLRLLARAAETLAALHGRGLVYVDPSPHNVFVSEAVDAQEVRLIDTDNLRPATSRANCVFTPGYGAPEIVRQKSFPSTLTDAYAFAVMAFETLALTHPMIGDAVRDGPPEREGDALAGKVPWIDEPADDSNRSSTGIPRDLVLSPGLRDDFQAAFGPGRNDPDARPGMARWAEHLHRAADRVLVCPGCGGGYYWNLKACPWCDADRPSVIAATVLLWDPSRSRMTRDGAFEPAPGVLAEASGKPRVMDVVVLADGETCLLAERVTRGNGSPKPHIQVTMKKGRLGVALAGPGPIRLVSADGRRERALGARETSLALGDRGADWTVHLGPDDAIHRVLRFDLHPGVTR